METARIIDETGRSGLWTEPLKEILEAAGFGLTVPENDGAGLTVLLTPGDADRSQEKRFSGDLLVISIPREGSIPDSERPRTEIIGTSRLKARFTLSDPGGLGSMMAEIRPLVKLFH